MRWTSLVALALVAACGPDQGPLPCPVGPDFKVLITAYQGPLPADTVLRLHYGGRPYGDPEELALAAPTATRALFCFVADRKGNRASDVPIGGHATRHAGAGGDGGEGGASFAPGEPVEALSCELWTDGSADLDVVTETYGTTTVKLETKKRVCVVEQNVVLTLDDAGVD